MSAEVTVPDVDPARAAGTAPDDSPGRWEMVARRFGQHLLDFALALGLGFLAGVLGGLVAIQLLKWGLVPPGALLWTPLITFVVVTLVTDLWIQVWLPLAHGGATPGMWVLGLRVVALRGGPPSVWDYLVRWFLFAVDGLLLGLVAGVSIAVTPRRQRVGDLLARTVVVRVS